MPPYRTSITRMYYAKEIKKDTPVPFAEFRVFVITSKPLTAVQYRTIVFPRIKMMLDRMEFIFGSIRKARRKRRIYYNYSIEGLEINKKIDRDEALRNLATTGLPKPKYNEFYRFAMFMPRPDTKKKPFVYNEADIRKLEVEWRPRILYRKWREGVKIEEEELPPEELWK